MKRQEQRNEPPILLENSQHRPQRTVRAFDNSKNPVACFEGLGSIFRENSSCSFLCVLGASASKRQSFTRRRGGAEKSQRDVKSCFEKFRWASLPLRPPNTPFHGFRVSRRDMKSCGRTNLPCQVFCSDQEGKKPRLVRLRIQLICMFGIREGDAGT